MKKITSLLLALIFSATLVFGAETPHFYTIKGFEKGLNNANSPFITPENQGIVANNVRWNKIVGGLSKRTLMRLYGSIGAFPVTSIWRYYKSDVTKFLIATGSTLIKLGDDATGTFSTIRTGMTDGKYYQWVTYKDIAIGTNGSDQPIKYDGQTVTTDNTAGARTVNELCAQLGAPFAKLATGSNLDASSWYMYKIAWYDGTTYSYSTAKSNPILTGSSVKAVDLTGIPLGPTGTTERHIYRTSGHTSQANVEASSIYYHLTTISNNTATTYSDNITDATIETDAAPTWSTVSAGINATVPKGTIAIIHNERLWISGNLTYRSDIYWSDAFNPQYFDPADYEQIRPDDGDSITFVKAQLGILTIGKNNTIQKYYTEGASTTWSVSDPLSYVGTSAPYSVTNTPLGIIYLARDGLYSFTGQYSQLLSDPIKPTIVDILVTSVPHVFGFWFKNEYHMAYISDSSGEIANNRVLVLDTVRSAYSIDIKNINCFAAFSSSDDFGNLYFGSSGTDGKIWSDEGDLSILNKRLKSEFDAGTFTDTVSGGTETSPTIELGWGITIDEASGTIDSQTGIIDREVTSGTWVSPIYEINAVSLDLLYWNETLNQGDITFQVRTGATTGEVTGASYSTAVTNPNGSDISGTSGAKYIQIKVNFSTTDITTSPKLFLSDGYVFKMTYYVAGTSLEPAVLSEWTSGFKDLGLEGHRKFIRRIKVYYTGTSGTLTLTYRNEQGTAERSFNIDLATDPASDTKDPYTGDQTNKVYTHFPTINSATSPAPVGQFWQFNISENGSVDWNINRIEIMFYPEEIGNT